LRSAVRAGEHWFYWLIIVISIIRYYPSDETINFDSFLWAMQWIQFTVLRLRRDAV